MFYLESDFESFISLIFALTPLSEGSVQHGQRLPALMVILTPRGSRRAGLGCRLGRCLTVATGDQHPHCVILWLDGSARCPLPLTAQAGAARLLGMSPGGSWSEGAVCVH